VVAHVQASHGVSERRSCLALGVDRSSVRYQSHRPDQAPLMLRIRDLAATRTRYGYFRIYILLRREGWLVNHKRVYRLYRDDGLSLRLKRPRRNVSAANRDRQPAASAVARQIGEHGLRPGERRLGIDDPVLFTDRRQVPQEGAPVGQVGEAAEEGEPPRCVERDQPGHEQAAEQLAEHLERQQERGPRGYPARAVPRDAAARHDHVDMRMVGQRRTPRVQHRGDADARAETLWIGGDRQHRLGRRLEQQIVDQRLVEERDVGNLGGEREDDMEVSHRQQVGLTLGEPGARGRALAPRAVPVPTTVIGDPPVPTVGAGLDVTAHHGGAAMLDRRHDLELVQAQMPGVCRPVRRAGSAEDVGDLE